MPKGRWFALLSVALVAFGALAVAKGGEKGPVPIPESDCYVCHAADDIPMVRMVGLSPPSAFKVPTDGSATRDFTATLTNAWVQTPDRGILHFTSVAATLDISKAPSLRFVAVNPDIAGNPVDLAVAFDLTAPNEAQTSTTVYQVPVGASTLAFHIEPKGSDLPYRFVVTPPGGEPIVAEVAAGAKGDYTLDGDIPAGNWTVGASVTFLDPAHLAPTTEQDFTVTEEVRFADAAARAKTLAYRVPSEESVLLQPILATWTLAASAEPGPDEVVTLRANSTAWFDHLSTPPTGDWGNFTEEIELRVEPQGANAGVVSTQTIFTRQPPINGPTIVTVSEAVGYASAILLVSSIVSGGMLGKASRRGLNVIFGSAKRRVAFHNVLSYGIIAAAIAHMALFLVEPFFNWTLGIIWGGLATVCMLGLGVTGAVQIPMIRRWSYGTWRWTHYGFTIGVLVLTVVHGLLDGVHFGELQNAIGWYDPLDPAIKA